ncbi:unnamed protein product, partial [Symbiodinium microadriaticum]
AGGGSPGPSPHALGLQTPAASGCQGGGLRLDYLRGLRSEHWSEQPQPELAPGVRQHDHPLMHPADNLDSPAALGLLRPGRFQLLLGPRGVCLAPL